MHDFPRKYPSSGSRGLLSYFPFWQNFKGGSEMRIRTGGKAAWLAALVVMLAVSGCHHPVTQAPPTPPPAPAPPPATPTVTLQASNTMIQAGQSSTLTWSSTNATTLAIAPDVGTVAPEGTQSVSPTESTTYTITATGPGGSADADARVALAKTADFLKAHPEAKVVIEGHCDERGSTEYNLALGDRRANAVKNALVSAGVGGDGIKTVSYGKEKPFCTESNEQCWQQNRRGHFVYQQ